MIYSEAFDAMPGQVKERVYRRLYDVLTGRDQSEKFKRLSAAIARQCSRSCGRPSRGCPRTSRPTPSRPCAKEGSFAQGKPRKRIRTRVLVESEPEPVRLHREQLVSQ